MKRRSCIIRKEMVFLVSLSLIILGSAARSHADTITIAGFTFAEEAFADYLTAGDYLWANNHGSDDSVLNSDVTDHVTPNALGHPWEQWFTVEFENGMVNNAGADLVVFDYDWSDMGASDIRVGLTDESSWGESEWYTPVNSGEQAGGHDIYYVLVDLSAFDVGDGDTKSEIRIGIYDPAIHDDPGPPYQIPGIDMLPSVGAIGVLHNVVPIPPTVVLLGLGLVSLVAFRRESKA